jgi:DNA mismatch repair protein MutH
MERVEAITRLTTLVGQDLRQLADQYRITVWSKEDKKNKGWAGHTIERYLGLALNSSRSPNFGSWELKLVPLIPKRTGELRVKETMAITMIDPTFRTPQLAHRGIEGVKVNHPRQK